MASTLQIVLLWIWQLKNGAVAVTSFSLFNVHIFGVFIWQIHIPFNDMVTIMCIKKLSCTSQHVNFAHLVKTTEGIELQINKT